jgi:hypothetical protein
MASGDLSETPFPLLLKRLYHSKTTGALHVRAGPHAKQVFVNEGAVVFASSTDRNDRLGEMLLRRGEISLPQFLRCSEAMIPGKRFGTALLENGVIGPEKLVWAVKNQVKEMVFSMFGLLSGRWSFVPGEDAGEEMITLNINTPDLIKEGIGRMDSIARPLDAFPSLRMSLQLTRAPDEAAAMFSLSPEETPLLEALRIPVELGELCRSSLLKPASLLRLLWVLLILGVVETTGPTPPAEEGPLGTEEMEVTGDDLSDLLPGDSW